MKKQNPKISVSKKLKDELDKLAIKKGDTYEEIIWRLLRVKNG